MTPRESDAALVEALRAGHSDAFEHLYEEYSSPIYNLCARVVCDREEARDLTQDVFISAFDHLRDPDAEPVRKLRPWLYRVATNACYNHLRSRKHLGGGDADLENASCEVDEYQRAETVALVEASLGQLNERYRTALVLKDLQGLDAIEIAEVMEVSRPNADVLVHRARASFKAAFAKLAGDVPAPAALGMVLLPLSLPAALQAMPSFAHPAAPPAPAPAPLPHAPVGHGVHVPGASHVGPAGIGGLLGKIGAALTTKVGITAAAATMVIGGTVAVKEVQHARAHPWTGTPGNAWQSAPRTWSKHWARWSLYGYWMKHGWPMGWNSGRWSWNGRMGGWSWSMDSGSTWSSGGMRSGSSSWSGGSWTMTMSRSGSSGWSSGGSWSGSGSKMSGSGSSWSGSGSHSSGSRGGGSSGGWDSGSSSGSGSSWDGSGSNMGGGSGSGW